MLQKLEHRPDGPLGSYADLTFTIYKFSSSSSNGISGAMNVDVSCTGDNTKEWNISAYCENHVLKVFEKFKLWKLKQEFNFGEEALIF